MKRLNRLLVAGVICLMGLAFAGHAQADELSNVTQGWIDAGLTADQVDTLLSGPSDTLGQRAEAMLNNGSITQRQYDKVYNNFMALDEAKRQQIKNAYTKGYADKIYNQTVSQARTALGDDASIRDHAKDLRQQGYTREQIRARLKAEGVSTQKIKDLGLEVAAPAAGSIRGSHAKERPQGAKDVRDTRKDVRQGQDVRERRGREGAFTRGRDAGAGRGTAGRRR